MALAIVLLSGAGVLVRSLVNIVGAETGVRDPEHILVGRVRLPSDKYGSPEKQLGYFDRFEHQLSSIPGIDDVAVSSVLPVYGADNQRFEIEARPDSSDSGQSVQFVTVESGYFRLLGTSVIAGRDFDDGDRGTSLPVAIVNQSFANTFWPGEQPLGKHLRVANRNQPGPWRTVVGIVSNIMQGDATRQRFKPLAYVPLRQQPYPRPFFLARTHAAVSQVAQPVRAELQKLDPDVLLEDFTTLEAKFAFDGDYMDVQHMELGKDAAVAPVFAFMALLLAAIGLYAVISHSVSQRTKEIGVRIAIGAAAKDVRVMVFREGMLPVLTGVLLGLTASIAVNRIMQSQLVGVSPYDPVTMAGAPAVLIVVALLACQIPARRAIKVDPAVALRHE
ncbi:MAG TPA: FtsX-like permease family protein, partial [Vicinamibacterales bacterium]|nr:FtsX-like permease family protein [Vicinamibacterales bacterium]